MHSVGYLSMFNTSLAAKGALAHRLIMMIIIIIIIIYFQLSIQEYYRLGIDPVTWHHKRNIFLPINVSNLISFH